jgi:BlaI family transcriptional regulator, penicillinase repressor
MKRDHSQLSRRERQIMDVIYRKGEAATAEVLEELPDPPSYSAVRAMLRILEDKGHLTHIEKGLRYVFKPTVAREKARQSALQQVVQTFFDNSTEKAVAALIHPSEAQLSDEQLNRLAELIQDARQDLNGEESSTDHDAGRKPRAASFK